MIGTTQTLEVVRHSDHGLYLDAGELGTVLLPTRQVPEGIEPGEELTVFLYHDSEDRPIATLDTPKAELDQVAMLSVVSVNDVGAFLDWGLQKDLFVPFREQAEEMEEGESYLVKIYQDDVTGRLVATSRLDRIIEKVGPQHYEGEEVTLTIAGWTDLGAKAIVNHTCWGILYESDTFRELELGQEVQGYVAKVRDDGKLDLTLQRPGYAKVTDFADVVLAAVKEEDVLTLTDRSAPEEIYERFGVSKKVFKKAVGQLYRKRVIVIEEDGIRLV